MSLRSALHEQARRQARWSSSPVTIIDSTEMAGFGLPDPTARGEAERPAGSAPSRYRNVPQAGDEPGPAARILLKGQAARHGDVFLGEVGRARLEVLATDSDSAKVGARAGSAP